MTQQTQLDGFSCVLVVGDNAEAFDLITEAVRKDGYRAHGVPTPAEVERLTGKPAATIILDVACAVEHALEWCGQLRLSAIGPILVVSDRTEVPSRVAALDAGADDFLGSPFAPTELRARVRALARRNALCQLSTLTRGNVHLDFQRRKASADGRDVHLSRVEWNIAELLASQASRVSERSDILEHIGTGPATLEVLVGRIRKKLGADLIRTVRGRGYAISPGD